MAKFDFTSLFHLTKIYKIKKIKQLYKLYKAKNIRNITKKQKCNYIRSTMVYNLVLRVV